MENKWILFENQLPTTIEGDQVQILFGHPKWATYLRGMYTHFSDDPIKERLSMYMQDKDEFWSWDSMMPTHWMRLPENPK